MVSVYCGSRSCSLTDEQADERTLDTQRDEEKSNPRIAQIENIYALLILPSLLHVTYVFTKLTYPEIAYSISFLHIRITF